MRKKIARGYMTVSTSVAIYGLVTMTMWLHTKKDLLEILVVSAVLAFMAAISMGAIFEAVDDYDKEQRAARARRKKYEAEHEYEYFDIIG